VRSEADADDCIMREPSPYLREAAVTLVPSLTNEQLERIDAQLETLANPYLLVSRISEHTALIQGIPVKAGSPVEADANTWETIFMLVTAALRGPFDWDTTITAIDVRDSDGALAS
jgi:hypothetical protein